MRPPRLRPLIRLHPITGTHRHIIRLPLIVCIRHNSTTKPTESPPQNLPSSSLKRSSISAKTAEYIDTLQLRALAATQRLNDITGYTSIESLKSQIQSQGFPPGLRRLLVLTV